MGKNINAQQDAWKEQRQLLEVRAFWWWNFVDKQWIAVEDNGTKTFFGALLAHYNILIDVWGTGYFMTFGT